MTLRGVLRYMEGAVCRSLSGLASHSQTLALIQTSCEDLRAAAPDETCSRLIGVMERSVRMIRSASERRDRTLTEDPAAAEIELLKCIWGLDSHLRGLAGQAAAQPNGVNAVGA